MNGLSEFPKVFRQASGLILLLAVLILAGQPVVSQAARPAAAPGTTTRTPTPTLIPTPTRTPLTRALRRQLIFAPTGGGAPSDCGNTHFEVQPQVTYYSAYLANHDVISLEDFPVGFKATVRIIDPQGKLAASLPIIIRDERPCASEGDDSVINSIPLISLSSQAPEGRWTVRVDGSGLSVNNEFESTWEYFDYTVGKMVPPGTRWYDSRRTSVLKRGDSLLVEGVVPGRKTELIVAIYRAPVPFQLVTAQSVITDRAGFFRAGFAIDSTYSPGEYYVHVQGNSYSEEDYAQQNKRFYFWVIQPSQACPGGMPSQLGKNGAAIVSAGSPNNVREKPGLGSRLVGKIYEYETVRITAGPKCADGLVWWKIVSENTGIDGWTAEGKDGDYWLNPF